MTNGSKHLLIKQAAKLVTLGVELEHERNKLAKLVAQGIPYTSPKIRKSAGTISTNR